MITLVNVQEKHSFSAENYDRKHLPAMDLWQNLNTLHNPFYLFKLPLNFYSCKMPHNLGYFSNLKIAPNKQSPSM
jgi:hypothetical protein